jgi:hypothetical protein
MTFDERLEAALAKKNIIREDAAPHTGIWYYLWLKPQWKLWTYPYHDVKKQWSHFEIWQELCKTVESHYAVGHIEEMQELPYCFPRGRVDTSDILTTGEQMLRNEVKDPVMPAEYYLLHGDWPSALSPAGELKKIISLFNLIGPANRNLVHVKETKHEMTDPKHVEAMENLIGGYEIA